MLASLLTRDIREGIKQFLVTGFEPSDQHLNGLMSRFIASDHEHVWLKGPYVQMGLPFRPGAQGRDFFGTFSTEFPGFTHQERAWARLRSGDANRPANTLVIVLTATSAAPAAPPG